MLNVGICSKDIPKSKIDLQTLACSEIIFLKLMVNQINSFISLPRGIN